jgi:predicted DNA-binding transcriptional regulator AlpA
MAERVNRPTNKIYVEPISLRIQDAVKASGLGRTSIYELIREGRLQSRVVAGRRLVMADSLRALLSGEAAND